MTVTYTSAVATSSHFGCFLKLLLRWRGSIYKLIWPELCVFMFCFYSVNFIYRYALDDIEKTAFEKIVRYCEKYGNLIPLSFVLGFYVNMVAARWWNQFQSIPFPDNLALLISASVKGDDDHGRIVRRTIMRYVCLSFAMTCTMISPKIKKRFPTYDHLVEAGLMEDDEKNIIMAMDDQFPSYLKYWLPLTWASNIVTRAKHEGMVRDDASVTVILAELNKFRTQCATLLDYDWISIPLIYTQVVTLTVYTYFLSALFGRQWIEPHKEDDIDLYFPILTILEFFFYMGWLKVAETLINPFGDDDDDFEIVWMVDRHIQVSYLIVDKIHHEHPKLMKDQYWAKMAPNRLPHTRASVVFDKEYPISSTENIKVKEEDAEILTLQYKHVDVDSGVHERRAGMTLPEGCVAYFKLPNFFKNPINRPEPKSKSDSTEFDKLCQQRQAYTKQKVIKSWKDLNKQIKISKDLSS